MIQGIFGELVLGQTSIIDLRKNQKLDEPQKSHLRQSMIFQQNAFQIEIQRPNFEQLKLNHPLLALDLTNILASNIFQRDNSKFQELINKNEFYIQKYNAPQDFQVAEQKRYQFASMPPPNKIGNQQDSQKNNGEYYPYISTIVSKNTVTEKNIDEITNYFRQQKYQLDRATIQFYVDAYHTTDPKKLLDQLIQNKII